MTRKDYIAIARVISDAQFIDCPTVDILAMNTATRRRIALALADVLIRDNPTFDPHRFLAACGLPK